MLVECGKLRNLTKSASVGNRNRPGWPVFFSQNFGLKTLKPSETPKDNSGGPKTIYDHVKLSIVDIPI